MKVKSISYKPSKSYKFFLFMIVPLLIGTTIALMSFTHANWNQEDTRLLRSPMQQGWIEGTGSDFASKSVKLPG